jgi:hypothetical protein
MSSGSSSTHPLQPALLLLPAAAVAELNCRVAMLLPNRGGDAKEGHRGGALPALGALPAVGRSVHRGCELQWELGSQNRAPGVGFVGEGAGRDPTIYAVEEEDMVLGRSSAVRGLAGAGGIGRR